MSDHLSPYLDKSKPLAARIRQAVYDNLVSDDLDDLLSRFADEIEAAVPVRVGICIGDGIVQYVRGSAPFSYFVADTDVFESCAGNETTRCDPTEDAADREEHEGERARFSAYAALPFEELFEPTMGRG